jgi:hypothetical protein
MNASLLRVALCSFFAVFVTVSILGQQTATPRPAVPVEPIAAILDAFLSHAVVAVPNAHGNEQLHAFGLSLVRAPRFASTVNDIVVEFGNARYQDVIDRFIRGDDVPDPMLRRVWQDTTQARPVWDEPMYEEFFRAVRALNATLPTGRQVRVLLGDPPIDWDNVRSPEDHGPWLQMRESYPADLIRREVLAKGRRALLYYGLMHFQRKNAAANFVSEGVAASIVSLLEDTGATKVFSLWWSPELEKVQPDVTAWPIPRLAIIRGTMIGATDFPYEGPRFAIRNGQPDFSAPLPRQQWRSMHAEDQLDAILYLGPRSGMTDGHLSPELCADPAYVTMRAGRMALTRVREAEIEQFKQVCADAQVGRQR